MNRTRQLTEAGLFAAIMVVMMIASFYIPLIGTFIFFIMPLPMIILGARNTVTNTIVAGIVATILASVLVTPIYGIGIGLLSLLVGFTIGKLVKSGAGPLKTVTLGALPALAGLLIIVLLMQVFMGTNLTEQLTEMFKLSADMQEEMKNIAASLGNADLNQSIADAQVMMEQMQYMMQLIFPAAMIIFAALYSWGNYAFSRLFLKRFNIPLKPLGPFKDFTYPKHLAYGSALMLILAFIVGKLELIDPQLVMANFLYLFIMVFAVQGLATLYYYFLKMMPKGFAIAILVILLFFGTIHYVALIGFFDLSVELRKRDAQKR